MQRYKGLGEMNPEQLWETTLDRDVRTLLQVKIGDLGEADEIFSTPDGRHRRAAPRVHPGQRAGGGEPGCVISLIPGAARGRQMGSWTPLDPFARIDAGAPVCLNGAV